MTKKLLLTAAALGAMAFAGAASAGSITGGTISGVPLTSGSGATLKVTPYTVAIEADLDAATGISSNDATTAVTVGLDSPVNLAAGAKVPFAVTFTLTGPATFESTFDKDSLVGAGGAISATGLVVMAADKKSVTFHVEYEGAAGAGSNVNALTLDGIELKVTGEQDVSIASEARVTVAGFTQVVGQMAATKIVVFKPALAGFETPTYTAKAMLPNFKTFDVQPANGTGGAATATQIKSNKLDLGVNQDVYGDLSGGTALVLGDIITGATATVKGPQIKTFAAAGLGAPVGQLADTEAKFNLSVADLQGGQLTLTQPGTAVAAAAATYTAEIKPTFETGFSGNANATLPLVSIVLDGTNFTAPWFALDSATSNSILRLANNGTSPIGPVVISLKSSNGSAATATHTIPSIAPGAFVSLRGDALKAAFGTTATNGDLAISVQSDATGLSAKVRSVQSNGQIFENSLGAGSQILVD